MLQSVPFSFAYTGRYNYLYRSLEYEGSSGNYWSRTIKDSSTAYNLGFGSDLVDPQSNHKRGYGLAIRCLAKP